MTLRGKLLGNRYELDEVIGRGGMAEVWRARDTRLQRDVAIKRLRVDLASDPTFQERFRREAHASAGLNHPNIVAVYDTGEEKDPSSNVMVPYIVMELVEGVTLREVLRGGRKIVPSKALEFTAGVLDALAYSHRAGIIHRDIKPANVMFTPPGTVKVMDFGIARAVADTSASMTQTAAVIGTAQYLSPEQARGEKVDNRSDLYAVGCLLYELLVSEPPFKGDSPVSVAYQHVREIPVPPSQRDPEVTKDMDAVVLKALAKDPRDRYQDATEFRDDIMRILNNSRPVAATQPLPVDNTATQVISAAPITATARRAAPPVAAAATGVMATGTIDGLPAYDDEVDEPKNRKGMVVLGVLGGILVIAVIAALFMLFGGNNPSGDASQSPSPEASQTSEPAVEMIAVPRVDGITQADAQNRLEDAGFVVTVIEVETDIDSQNGLVERTDPAGGTEVEKGSTVSLYVFVYKAPEDISVPSNLVGMTEQGARDALVNAGFDSANIRTVNADPDTEPITAKKGTVVSVSPTGTVSPDATVTLVIATGESRVPDLIGMTQNRAIDAAKEAGFEVEIKFEVATDTPEGVVFDQNPVAGASLSRSMPITITVAKAADDGENP